MTINDARKNFAAIKKIYDEEKVYDRFPLGDIWETNLNQHLSGIISEAKTSREAISRLNDKQFYDFTCGGEYLAPTIDWRLDYLRRVENFDIKDLPPDLEESDLIAPQNTLRRDGRLLSADFINRLMWIKRLQRHVDLQTTAPVVMEIGGGFGAMIRVVRNLYQDASCIMVDIPETLFFLEIFLRHHFPDDSLLYVLKPVDLRDAVAENRFVLVPHFLADGLEGQRVDLLLNTNSFGEMRSDAIRRWFDLIQNRLDVRWFFSLNRFLNRVRMPDHTWRLNHLAWSFFMDRNWIIEDWEVDPEFERCPYLYTIATRNLLVLAKRHTATRAEEDTGRSESRNKLGDMKLHDWNRQPYWDRYVRKFGSNFPPLMSRADRDLTPDLTQNGTLHALWDAVRIDKSLEGLTLLKRYLEYLCGTDTPAEEVYYLMGEIAKLENAPTD